MLREPTEGGGIPGLGGGGDFPDFRGGPAGLPPLGGSGTPPGNVPAAFGGNKKPKK
ncbi:MAG TPA: hypothetical protein VI365_27045 [Trebonia sp.]